MKPAEPSASDLSSAARSGKDLSAVAGTAKDLSAVAGTAKADDNTPPAVDVPDYRPVERFWPYLDLPEQPTDEELARLDPELAEALFGTPRRPFSVSLEFPDFDGPDFERALGLARASAELLEIGTPPRRRYRARFYSKDAPQLRDLFEIVGRFDGTDVLIDDRPVPYARELWLPLLWFLIR